MALKTSRSSILFYPMPYASNLLKPETLKLPETEKVTLKQNKKLTSLDNYVDPTAIRVMAIFLSSKHTATSVPGSRGRSWILP